MRKVLILAAMSGALALPSIAQAQVYAFPPFPVPVAEYAQQPLKHNGTHEAYASAAKPVAEKPVREPAQPYYFAPFAPF
jgi:hypothetical protein